MNRNNTWPIFLFVLVMGAALGSFATYAFLRPQLAAGSATEQLSRDGSDKVPSAVFDALSLPALAEDFAPDHETLSIIEDLTQIDAETGFHRKYYAIVFDRGDVGSFVDHLHSELSSKRLNDEIAVLNRFEVNIPQTVSDAGGTVAFTTARRATHSGDSIQTRYCFDYTCGKARGAVRVWIVGRHDQCIVLLLASEQIV